MHSCPHLLQCRFPFPLFISCFFSSVYSAHVFCVHSDLASVSPHPPLLTNPPSLWPHSFFLPAFTHPCISSSLQLKECQRGLSSAPLQRPLWLSPPHVLPPHSPKPPPPTRSLSLCPATCSHPGAVWKRKPLIKAVPTATHSPLWISCVWKTSSVLVILEKERPVICLRLWHPIEVSIVQQKSGVFSWQFLFDSYYFNDLSYFHYRPKIPVEPKLSFVQTVKEELDDSAVLNCLIGLLI